MCDSRKFLIENLVRQLGYQKSHNMALNQTARSSAAFMIADGAAG